MDSFLGEVRIVGFNYAPRGWASCDGQILPIGQYSALFSLLGISFGGNGTTNFALPNFNNNVPMHQGQGAGLSNRTLGQSGGSSSVTLLANQLGAHTHALQGRPAPANGAKATSSASLAQPASPSQMYKYDQPLNTVNMSPASIAAAGGNGPHNNMQPYLSLCFIISLQGEYPQRP